MSGMTGLERSGSTSTGEGTKRILVSGDLNSDL